MTFIKGQSGNPGGRKSLDPDVKAMFSPHLPAAIEAVLSCLKSKDEGIRLKASNMVLERVVGKPAQAVQISGDSPFDNICVNVSTKTK